MDLSYFAFMRGRRGHFGHVGHVSVISFELTFHLGGSIFSFRHASYGLYGCTVFYQRSAYSGHLNRTYEESSSSVLYNMDDARTFTRSLSFEVTTPSDNRVGVARVVFLYVFEVDELAMGFR